MSEQNVPRRGAFASGGFDGGSNGSFRQPDIASLAKNHARMSAFSSLNDETPSWAISPNSNGQSLDSRSTSTTDSVTTQSDSSRKDWRGSESMTLLSAIGNHNGEGSSGSTSLRLESDSSGNISRDTYGKRLGELLSLSSNESKTIHETLGDPGEPGRYVEVPNATASSRSLTEKLTAISDSLSPSSVISDFPLISALSSDSLGFNANNRSEGFSERSTTLENRGVPSQGIGLPDWTKSLSTELPGSTSQNWSDLSDTASPLAAPMLLPETDPRVTGSLNTGAFDRSSESPLLGLGPSFNAMVTSRLTPSSLFDVNSITNRGGSVGPAWNRGPGESGDWQSDFNGSSEGGQSQSIDGRVDLSKTNELLQQLLEEVRKGRQGFLPMNDRNSTY